MYRTAAGDPSRIPWASDSACPIVVEYLADHPGPGKAIIVGSGLGDDSEAVAAAGYDAVGFDVSSEAIAWCRRRFPDSDVDYRVADLFSLPDGWMCVFGLVVENRTAQALPPDRRPEVLDAVASLVAPGGTLLIVARARDEGVIPHGPPWAVSEREMGRLVEAGLTLVSLDTLPGRSWADLVGEYRRP